MEIRKNGNVIIVRLLNSGEIMPDTTLTSICRRFGINHEKIRAKKYPFWYHHEDESYHFQKIPAQEVQKDDFRKIVEN